MKEITALKEQILQYVTLRQILTGQGIIGGIDDQEQIHCPFHGADQKKSARYYGRTDSFYCWVCRKSWDLFSYVADKNGVSFREALKHLITVYKVDISSVPEISDNLESDRLRSKHKVAIDERKRYLLQLHGALLKLKNLIDPGKYGALVYSYMVMKYITPDEKFYESAEKMNAALTRVMRK